MKSSAFLLSGVSLHFFLQSHFWHIYIIYIRVRVFYMLTVCDRGSCLLTIHWTNVIKLFKEFLTALCCACRWKPPDDNLSQPLGRFCYRRWIIAKLPYRPLCSFLTVSLLSCFLFLWHKYQRPYTKQITLFVHRRVWLFTSSSCVDESHNHATFCKMINHTKDELSAWYINIRASDKV